MRVAPRRLWGWEPETRIVPDGDGWRVEREPEFDKEQYELLVALHEHEASLNSLGIPLDEAMSIDADPENRDGKYEYVARARRDWAEEAIHQEQSAEKWSGQNYTPARKFFVERVER